MGLIFVVAGLLVAFVEPKRDLRRVVRRSRRTARTMAHLFPGRGEPSWKWRFRLTMVMYRVVGGVFVFVGFIMTAQAAWALLR
jgi:hypothetical protein